MVENSDITSTQQYKWSLASLQTKRGVYLIYSFFPCPESKIYWLPTKMDTVWEESFIATISILAIYLR